MIGLATVLIGCAAVWLAYILVPKLFHLCTFFEIDSGTSTLLDINAVTDGWATVQNNHFIFQEELKLAAFIAFGSTITRAQLNTPHWRYVNQPEFVPYTTTWMADTQGLTFPVLMPPSITIPRIDEVQFLASTSGVSSTGLMGAMWVHDGRMNIPPGDIYPTRFTATIAGATGAWQRGNLAFDTSLPAGRYSVVGLDIVGSAFLLGRLRFPSNVMLPGVPVRNSGAGLVRDIFRYGKFGEFGQFEQTAQPSLELFSNLASGTSVTGVMDLIKVR